MTIPVDPELLEPCQSGLAVQSARSSFDAATLFHQLDEAISCYQPDGTIVYVNPAAERAFGTPAAGLVGCKVWELLPDLIDQPFHLGFQKVCREGDSAQLEQYVASRGNWYAVTLYPVGGLVCAVARDTSAERKARLRLEVLAAASRAFSAAGLNLQAAFDAVARRLAELLGDTCIVRALRPDGGNWESLLGAHDSDPTMARFVRRIPLLGLEDGFNGEVIRSREPLLLERVDPARAAEEHPNPGYRHVLRRLRPHSVMVVPVLSGTQLLGTIAMCRRVSGNPRPYEREDLLLLTELANRAALAIVNAREYHGTAVLEERLRLAVEAAEMGIWDYEPQRRRFCWDDRCRALFGLPPSAPARFELCRDAVHPEDAHAVEAAIAGALAGELGSELDIEFRVRGIEDGVVRWLTANGRALFDAEGRPYRFTGTLLDISRQKSAELEREAHMRELELNLRFSDTFVGVLGHDLRSPLSAITTTAQLLRRRADSERLAVPAQRIVTAAQRMQRMIEQLLDFTRIRLGGGLPLSRQTVDLAQLCRQVADELASSGRHNPLQLSCDGDASGDWDPDRLWQLVSNVTGNALQHGTPGTPVQVRIDGLCTDEVRLEVLNQGEVPRALLTSIFDPLKPQSRRRAGSSGLGLGLYISHQIALAHQGSIVMSSGPKEGTRLVVTLPRRAATASSLQLGSPHRQVL